MMTKAEKTDFLSLYRLYEAQAEEIKEEIALWRQRGHAAASGFGKGHSVGGHSDPVAYTAEKIEELTQKLFQQYQICLNTRIQIENAIAELPVKRLQVVLRLKYVKGMTLEAVAEKLDLCGRQVARLHNQALGLLQVPEQYAVQNKLSAIPFQSPVPAPNPIPVGMDVSTGATLKAA